MEYFPKSLVFWKGESSALAILLKEKLAPLFFSEDPNTCCPVESGRGTLSAPFLKFDDVYQI